MVRSMTKSDQDYDDSRPSNAAGGKSTVPNSEAIRAVFDMYRENAERSVPNEIPPQVAATLIAIAAYAQDRYGRGSFPSAATVAHMIGKSPRQVQRDITWLTQNGYLSRAADQKPAKSYGRMGNPPVVYDLGWASEIEEREVTQQGVSPRMFERLCNEKRRGIDHDETFMEAMSETQWNHYLYEVKAGRAD